MNFRLKVLTNERLHALHNVNRWGGWLHRPYGVLEHTVIGAELLHRNGRNCRAFLMHDMEESEFGDITTPNKSRYTNGRYARDVDAWNAVLCAETDVNIHHLHSAEVNYMDYVMAHAEHLTVATRGDDAKYDHLEINTDVNRACLEIESAVYADFVRAAAKFWELFNASGKG